jgi:hypothetical protein
MNGFCKLTQLTNHAGQDLKFSSFQPEPETNVLDLQFGNLPRNCQKQCRI